MSKPSIISIAIQLGLSKGTVSKALRDSHEISEATKQRVKTLVQKLNYVPNPYASSLRRQRSKTIAVVLPEVTDSFFSLAINGIESVAKEKGYHVLIYLTHESVEREEAILKDFQSGRVDGILMSVSAQTCNGNHIEEVINEGIPVVFFDRVCESVNAPSVTTNDFESGYNAAIHLVKMGCKRISFLHISSGLSISNKRMEGFKSAMEDAGIKFGNNDITECNDDMRDNINRIKKLLKKKNKPEGIIASVEKLSAPVYSACNELKISIPRKLKLISFTNLQTASILNPSLTTITQPAFEMGQQAALTLFKKLEKKKNSFFQQDNIIIKSELVKRDSTKR